MQESYRRVPSVGRLLAVTAVAVGLCTVVATVLALLEIHDHGVAEQVSQAMIVIAAALFLGAGVLRVSRWRIAGDQRSLLMGTALVVLGGVAIPLTSLAGVIVEDDDRSLLRAATAICTTGVTLLVVMRAVSSRDSSSPHAVRLLGGAVGAAVLLFLVILCGHVWAPQLLQAETFPPRVVRGSLLAVAWLYVAMEAALRSAERPWAGRLAPLLGCMGVAEVLRVVAAYHDGGWELASTALVACLAAITAHRSLLDLDEATDTERQHFDTVSDALHHSREGSAQQHAWREELEHDARNALAGLRAALTTLEKYHGVLDGPTSDRLRSAALGEISHLEHLIIRSDQSAVSDFDVAEVLANVVEAQRANGVRVSLHTVPAWAHGNPGDLATALQNLLVNARDHGGNDVTVQAATVAGRIEVYVADRGPGLAESQVATLFQRGARGPASTGSGLGLHVSRTLMRRQGGDLQLRCHQGGAIFALVLPVAPAVVVTDLASRQRARSTSFATTFTAPGTLVAGQEAR